MGGTGPHFHGRAFRVHSQDLGNTNVTLSTSTAPATSTSVSTSPNLPASGYAVAPQSVTGGSGWTYYGGGSHAIALAPINPPLAVNPGGPMIPASGAAPTVNTQATTGLPGGPMILASGAAPTVNTQAATDIQKLQSDTQAIELQSQVTVGELTGYAADLQAISPASGQPSSVLTTAFQTLESDQSAILASGTFTAAQQAQIVNDVAAILTNEGATAAQASKASTDLQTIITASGLNSTNVAQIDSDLMAVQADLSKTGSVTTSSSTTTTTTAASSPTATTTSGSTTNTTSGSTTTTTATVTSTPLQPPLPGPMNFGGGLLLQIVMGQGQGPIGPMTIGLGGPPVMGIASPMIMPIAGVMNVAFGGGPALFATATPPSTGGSSSTSGSTTS